MQKDKVVIYLYNRFHDPLIQSNIFLYIKKLVNENRFDFALVTYENTSQLEHEEKSYILSKRRILETKAYLDSLGIKWVRLSWISGQSLFSKFKCFIDGFNSIRNLRTNGYNKVISLGSVAGSFAYVYSKILKMDLYLYQYEPHSEYQLDTGYFSEKSLSYKVLNRLEYLSAKNAKVISSGTRHMEKRLKNWSVDAKFFKIPSVVNQEKFKYSDVKRKYIRDKYGIRMDSKVILYAGKFGGLYFYDENPKMFSYLRSCYPDFTILIVTLNPIVEIRALFAKHGLTDNLYITSSTYEDIDKYLCAADFGIVSVESGPSKKFVSNIKVGEYLSCGLPYLICGGISEDDWYAEKQNVGVVVKDFSETEILNAYPMILKYLNMPLKEIKEHCRNIGVSYRGFTNLYPRFKAAIEYLTNQV